MRVGILGLGFMGTQHVQALTRIPGVTLAAVMSRNERRLAGDLSGTEGNLGEAGRQMDFSGVAKYRKAEELIADGSLDAVDICLPTNLHASVAIEALRAGKHVLVEKPMALEGSAAGEMLRVAREQHRVLMVAQVLRFFPAYVALKRIVKSGQLGRVRAAIFRRRCAVPDWAPWMLDRAQSGGGVFDLLIHDVDIALDLFGRPGSISATGCEDLEKGIDIITSEFHYPSMGSITITGGWHHAGAYPFSMEFTVIGDGGVVEYSSAGRPATVYWAGGSSELIETEEKDPYQAEIEYFIACARANTLPELCPPEESADAVKATRLIVEAREQKGETIPCAL